MSTRVLGRRPLRLATTLVAVAIGVGLIVTGAFAQRGGRGGCGGYNVPCPPPPSPGVAVNVAPVSGTVLVKEPDGRFVQLRAGDQVPVGSILDTRKGTVSLTSAQDTSGATQNGTFRAGLFKVGQAKSGRPFTVLTLTQRLSCPRASASGNVTAAARSRQLFSNARGRFRTRGRNSTATVRGTKWLTKDRCDGTLTKVQRGSVKVRDLRKRRTIIVKAGDSYLAKNR